MRTIRCVVFSLIESCLLFALASAQGPIANYMFTGNTNDASGNGLDGTATGATLTTDRFGIANAAYLFASSSDRITLPAGSIGMTSTAERSFSLWIKPTSVPTAPNNGGLIAQYLHGSPSVSNFFIGLDQSSGVFRINVTGDGNDRLDVALGFNPIGRWTHVVVLMKDGTNNTHVYVNNTLLQSGTLSYNTANSSRSPVIGDIDGGANSDNFPGAIDDIYIYNRILSSVEIAARYGARPIASYPFTGNANDASGNGLNGTVSGATLTTDRFGAVAAAYLFASSSDRITMPAGSIGMADALERSFSLWIKPNSVPVAPNNGGLISQYLHGSTSTSNFFIGLDQTGGVFRINVAGDGSDRLDVPLSFNPVAQWTHIVVLMKAGTNNTKVYVNNALLQSGTVTYNPTTSGRSPIIGDIDGGSNSDNFPGVIDDIYIYDQILSSAEIMALYGTGATSVQMLDSQIPQRISLRQNYPNPFNPSTTIEYGLPRSSRITLAVYNALGQLVATLVDQNQEPGVYRTVWGASSVPSGIYFYRLRAGDFVQTKKMLLLK
jgi:hypothetical protein